MSIKSRLCSKVSVAAVAAFLLLAGNAFGSEGVIEINQAAALAGGITPSDTPGFPVTLDQPGSYRLTGDLVHEGPGPAQVIGLVITAEDVSLDLGGFSVSVGNTNAVPGSNYVNPISVETDNFYIHDGSLIVTDGFHSTSSYFGSLGSYERIRFEKAFGYMTNAHSAYRQSSSSRSLRLVISGLAVANEGEIFVKNGLISGHQSSNYAAWSEGGSVLVIGSQLNTLAIESTGHTAYGRNVISGGLFGSGIGSAFEIGTNVCGTDTTCP
jgi:hypothetical protein